MNASETAGQSSQPGLNVNVLAGTLAEMTWQEVQAAAQRGAVLLWAFGVIEQHGPHLPAGTDIYVPSIRLQQLKAKLAQLGVEALVVPPFYWGVNQVSAAFPVSYTVRAEVMIELMADVFESIKRDGFSSVFCFTGHGDAAHNRAIFDGVAKGVGLTGMDISFVADRQLAARTGMAADSPYLTSYEGVARGTEGGLDIHAGEVETSTMMCYCGELVRGHLLTDLLPTNYGPDDLAEWRRGGEFARRKTPLGYFGHPAAAHADLGKRDTEAIVASQVAAICRRLDSKVRR